jgi:hypothetical protein
LFGSLKTTEKAQRRQSLAAGEVERGISLGVSGIELLFGLGWIGDGKQSEVVVLWADEVEDFLPQLSRLRSDALPADSSSNPVAQSLPFCCASGS